MINGSRRKRIARGSGTSVEEVNRLLKQFVQMRKMLKSLGGMAAGRRRQAAVRWGCRLRDAELRGADSTVESDVRPSANVRV